MCIQSIKLSRSFCNSKQERQTDCSVVSRTIACGLGAISLLIGVLILSGVLHLPSGGFLAGGLCVATGASTLLAGGCLQIIKEKEAVFDFSTITPATYAKHLKMQKFDSYNAKLGDFLFTKKTYSSRFGQPASEYLDITIINQEPKRPGGMYGYLSGLSLKIHEEQFVYDPHWDKPAVHFSNLQAFFDYLFKGAFYQGECISGMEFFTLKTVDGKEVRYNNPSKNAT